MQTEYLSTIRLSNQSIRIMIAMLADVAIDAGPILAAAGLSQAALSNPTGEVSGLEEFRFQTGFAKATAHIPGLWMRTGMHYRLMSYGPLGLAVLAAADVADGLRVLSAFQALTFSLMHYKVEEKDNRPIALTADDTSAPLEFREFLQERALGSVTMFLNDMRGQRFPLDRIESVLGRPSGWQGCDALLGTPVVFGAPVTRWIFSKDAGSASLPMASPLLEETYTKLCSKLIEDVPSKDEFLSTVFQIVVRAGRGFPTAPVVAEQLGISERSLYRKLDARSTSYGDVIDKVRFQRAKELLESSTLSVEVVAEMLGFSETASFSRAFRRWAGVPPSRYRSAARGV